MMNLQPTVTGYTVAERAAKIYNTVVDIFDYNTSSDVVTPLPLAKKQLEGIKPSGAVCIPGAGIGTYVLAAIEAGFNPADIYAVEFNRAYFCLGSGIYTRLGVNYIYADYLTWEPGMKFDVVIGNPPYQDSSTESKDKKLWTKFVDKSLEHLKPQGSIIFLTPNSLVGRTRLPAKRREMLSTRYSLDWVDHNANNYFPQVGVDICSWCITNRPYTGVTKVVDGHREEKIDLRTDLPTPFVLKERDNLVEKMYSCIGQHGIPALERQYNDVDQTPVEDGKYLNYYSGRNKSFRTNDTCKNTGKLKVVFSFSATYKQWFITSDNVSGSNLYVEVSSVEEGLKIGSTLMHPVLTFYLDNWRRTAGYCPAIRNVGALPDIRGLTDKEIIEGFNLTKDEYNYIMSEYVPYKKIERVF
jgi:hypothetical protein